MTVHKNNEKLEYSLKTRDYTAYKGNKEEKPSNLQNEEFLLDKLNSIKTKDNGQGEKSKPVDDVVIDSISVDTKGKDYPEPDKLNEDKDTEKKYSNF